MKEILLVEDKWSKDAELMIRAFEKKPIMLSIIWCISTGWYRLTWIYFARENNIPNEFQQIKNYYLLDL